MSLKQVFITSGTCHSCLSHALTTESQEIMGLLLGELDSDYVCHIVSSMVLTRSDKRANRVEISPEQLSQASCFAEKLSLEMNKPVRIVGWYHSHPHITVWPSNVDIWTQASYQLLDQGFVGLIFSVFNSSKQNLNKIQICCFQSFKNGENYEKIDIPLEILGCNSMTFPDLRCLTSLTDVFTQEEEEAFQKSSDQSQSQDFFTRQFNLSVYNKNMIEIMEVIHIPLAEMMKNKLDQNKRKINFMRENKNKMLSELKQLESKQEEILNKKREEEKFKASVEEKSKSNNQKKKKNLFSDDLTNIDKTFKKKQTDKKTKTDTIGSLQITENDLTYSQTKTSSNNSHLKSHSPDLIQFCSISNSRNGETSKRKNDFESDDLISFSTPPSSNRHQNISPLIKERNFNFNNQQNSRTPEKNSKFASGKETLL